MIEINITIKAKSISDVDVNAIKSVFPEAKVISGKRTNSEVIEDMYKSLYNDLKSRNSYSICINLKELKAEFCSNDNDITISFIKFCIVDCFGIEYQNGRYLRYDNDFFEGVSKEKKGSYFHITRKMLADAIGIKENN